MTINKKLLKAQQYLRDGYYSKAIEILDKYLKNSPTDYSGLMLRGEAFLRNEQFELALIDYAKIVESDNKNILALNNFSLALIRCNKPNEAKEIIQYVHELEPDNFAGFINLGNIHQALGEHHEAVNSAMRAVEINPKSPVAYLNLGSALGSLGQTEASKQAILMASYLNPKDVITKINIAQMEEKLGNYYEAKLMYEGILNLKNISPLESNLVKYYLSYTYLYLGELAKAWSYYDYGFAGILPNNAIRSPRKFNQPQWNGNFAESKTILIWREQGLGDEILFSSCLNDVHELDLNIIFECDPRLVDIFQRTYPKFTVRRELFQEDFYSPHNDFELHIALGSLPKYFRNNIKDFERKPTIWKPLLEYVNVVRGKLQPYRNKRLIGICWRSSLLSVDRNLNYTVLRDWEALLCNPSYQFVNLLHGDCEAEISEVEQLFGIHILRWKDIDLKNDLETVLALVTELDFVVSIGSAVSVIAAAGGVKTSVLVQESWVQLGHPEKYHWFPNVVPFVAKVNEHVGINIGKLANYISENITNKNFK